MAQDGRDNDGVALSVAIITGSGRGIGAATAKLAAKRGYAVCVNYSEDAEHAERVMAEIRAAGGKAIAVRADVAKEEAALVIAPAEIEI